MWRTIYISQPKAVSAQPVHKQRALGLPARAHRSRAGLPPIQLAQALLGRRPTRLISQLVRSTGSQDEADSSSTAGPLVPTPQQQNGNLPAAQSGAAGPGRVPVQFVVPEYLTHWGQVLKVVGSLEELGSWKVEKAPSMQWNEGHTWTLDIQLPVGAVNFKIVMHDQPNSNVRWELGEDRSVLIPETTTVTGAPVGQVGVTCNFNDVHNSRVEVRPDRAYLKQQLKAVEARVLAIQEKKRKLDQRMSVLTTGLKKYDATVAMLQDGVQAAVEARRSSKESAKQLQQSPQQQNLQQPAERQQHQQEHQQAAAASSNGAPSDKQQQAAPKVPASFNPLGQKASIQVPILDPSQLPSFADAPAAAAAAAAAEESTAASSTISSSSLESSTDEAQQTADSAAVVAADSSSSRLAYAPDVSAIKASHVNETVLSATVDQLLAAAEDALARSTPSEPIPNLSVGAAGVDDVQLAEEYVEELLAAASALEQQADRRASLLLEAAQRSGDSDMAADIEQLAAAELPPIPTVEELAEAAAAAAAITVSLDEELPAAAAAAAAVSSASMSSSNEAAEAPAAAAAQPLEQQQQVVMEVQLEPQQQQQQQQQQQARSASLSPVQRVDKDGSITFTAESLSVDVDVKQLLAAVLSRVGIPLGGNVTISASFTPNEAASPDTTAAAGADAIDAAAEASMDHNVDSMAASSSSGGNAVPDQQQQQQQQEQKEKKPQRRLSPIEAIAAVFSRGNSIDSEDENDDSSSGGSSGGSNGRGQGFRNSSSNGASAQGKGRYSKAVSTGSEQPYTSSTTAAAAPNGSNGGSSDAQQPAQMTVRMDLQDLSKQLEAKEAARRAAAERVAAALAQVEEMRRSVVAANSMLRQQLLGAEGPNNSSGSSSSASTSVTGDNGSSSSSGVRTGDGRVYSRYRVAYKGVSQAPAAPAADAASSSSSSSSSSSAQQGNGSKPEPVSAPGAPRGMPAIAATAVDPAQLPPKPRQAGKSAQQQQQEAEVEGEVREELSLLAALAAEVQKQSRDRTQQ